MIAKKVRYKGFDGQYVEEIVRLNLTKAEVLNMDLKYIDYGGLKGYYRMLITNVKEGEPAYKPMVSFLQHVILTAYGEKTEDGKFIKKRNGIALADEFETSEAYSELLLSLLSDKGIDEIEPLLRGIFPEFDENAVEEERKKLEAELGI